MKNYLTKREKFKRLYGELRDFGIVNRFRNSNGGTKGKPDPGCSVERMMDEKQKTASKTLWHLYMQRTADAYSDWNSNKIEYEDAIQTCERLIREMLAEWVGEPIVFANGFEYRTIGEYMREFEHYLNCAEWSEAEFESGFACVYGNHEIKKLATFRNEDGHSINHIYGVINVYPTEALPEWIQLMGEGLYEMDGIRFDIHSSEACIYNKDEDDHPIGAYVDEIALKRWLKEMRESAVDCVRCGDGGCPSCRPQWFI